MAANVKLVAEIVVDGAKAAVRQLSSVKDEVKNIDKETLNNVKRGFDVLGAAAIVAGGYAVKTAMEFDVGMRQVNTLLTEAEENSMDWGEAYKQASIETGKSLTEITGATYQAISAGIEYGDSVEFVTEQNKLAVAGQTDLASAIDVTTKTLNAYGLGAEDAARINDILIATQNNGITTVDELSSSLAAVTPTAAAMGVSFEQVGAAMATMTAQGTPTSQAATQLNALLGELGKSGTIASEKFQELSGQTFQEFIAGGGTVGEAVLIMTQDLEGMDKTILSVAESLPRLEDGSLDYASAIDQAAANNAGFEQSLIDQFGSLEAAKAAMQLASGAGSVYATNLDEIANSAGSTTEAYGDMVDGSPAFMFDQLKASVGVLAVDIGESLLPAVTELVENFTNLVNWMQENEGMAKLMAAGIIFLVSAFVIINIAITVYTAATTLAAIASSAMFAPIIAVIGAIALLIAIIIMVVRSWDDIKAALGRAKEAIAAFWEDVKRGASDFWEGIKGFFIGIWEWLKANWDVALSFLITVLFGAFGLMIGLVIKFKDEIAAFFGAMWDWIKDKFTAGKETVVNAFKGMKDNVLNVVEAMKSGIMSKVDWIISKLQTFKNKVISIKDGIVDGFKNMVSGIATGISGGVDTLISKVKNMVNTFMITPLNSAIGVINKIPNVEIPKIPALAKGGIVGLGNNGTIAQVGEAGPEAVIPLKDAVLGKIGNMILKASSIKDGIVEKKNNITNYFNIDAKTFTIEQLEEMLRVLALEGGK